jgi:exopolysaccharide production protein ExoZ
MTFSDPRAITWTHPFLLLFLGGMGLAMLWQRVDFSPFAILMPVGLTLACIAALQLLPEPAIVLTYFLAALLTVAGTLAAQARWPDGRIPGLAAIGDASYSIYLSHTIVLIFVMKGLVLLPLSGWAQTVVTGLLAATICTSIGLVVYHLVERPMLQAMRRRLDHGG